MLYNFCEKKGLKTPTLIEKSTALQWIISSVPRLGIITKTIELLSPDHHMPHSSRHSWKSSVLMKMFIYILVFHPIFQMWKGIKYEMANLKCQGSFFQANLTLRAGIPEPNKWFPIILSWVLLYIVQKSTKQVCNRTCLNSSNPH